MLKKLASECLQCKNPLCIKGCPVHNDIKGIINMISCDKITDAYKLNLNTSVLPFVCGTLCPHEKQCVGHCVKGIKGKAVSIGEIESLLSKANDYKVDYIDYSLSNLDIAIIGGGISGISAAIDARRHHANVTIYEKTSLLGGPLAHSIPEFRFDKESLDIINEIINSLDIKVNYNKEYNKDFFLKDLEKFDKIIFATGTNIETSPIKEEHPCFIGAVKLLNNIKNGISYSNVKKAIVLGAGNVATDAARSLKRLGIDTSIVYRRTFQYSPALVKELADCKEEEINLIEKLSPISLILENENLKGVCFEEMEESDILDKTARPIFVGTSKFVKLDCDLVVYATGQKPDLKCYNDDFSHLIDGNWFKSNTNYLINDKYYFIGDLVSGATTIVNAMKAGMDIIDQMINERTYFMFGGSFDPVTIIHEKIIESVVKEYPNNSLIYIVPNGDNYHFDGKKLTPFEIRKEMLETALKEYKKHIVVLDIEQKEEFKGIYKTLEDLNHPLYIMGSDLLYTLPRWKNFDELMNKNKFYLIERAGYSLDELNSENLSAYQDSFIISKLKFENISSTEFRKKKNTSLISKEVDAIIKKYDLYKGGASNE